MKRNIIIAVLVAAFSHQAFAISKADNSAAEPPKPSGVQRDGNIISEAERRPLSFIQSAINDLKNHNSQNAVNDLLAAAASIDSDFKTSVESQMITSEPLKLLAADIKMKGEISTDEVAQRLAPLLVRQTISQHDRAKFYWNRSETHATGSALNLAADYFTESRVFCQNSKDKTARVVVKAKEVATTLLENSKVEKSEVRKVIGDFDTILKRYGRISTLKPSFKEKIICSESGN